MIKKTAVICIIVLQFYNCWPNGQSRRDQCKRGIGQGSIDNALGERNTWCSFYLLQISEPQNQRLSSAQNATLALCINAQNYLNQCEKETTLPLGTGDIK